MSSRRWLSCSPCLEFVRGSRTWRSVLVPRSKELCAGDHAEDRKRWSALGVCMRVGGVRSCWDE
eukprot:3906862-Rhodomonas_salina.1